MQEAAQGDAAWRAAYKHASDKRLPRQLRVFGWRILHAAVRVGGSRVYCATSEQELLDCCCRQPQCRPAPAGQQQQQQQQQQGAQQLLDEQQQQQLGELLQQGIQQQQQQQQGQHMLLPDSYQLETLSHLFVQCPIAVEVWAWFAEQVWARVQPGETVDFSSSRILMLDDGSIWQPPAALQQLWTYLRLLLLESIWVVRCSSSGKPFSSRQVISRFLAALQQQLKQDWARTLGDIGLNSGVPLSWLKGRSPVLSAAKFAAK